MMIYRKKIGLLILSAIIILIFAVIYYYREKIKNILIPVFMGIIIAYIIRPIVLKLEQRKISCSVSVWIIYIASITTFIGIIIFVVPELINNIKELSHTLPTIISKYQMEFNSMLNTVKSSKWPNDFKAAIFQQVNTNTSKFENFIGEILNRLVEVLVNTVGIIFNIIVALIIAYYLIRDAKVFKNVSLYLLPLKWHNKIISIGREINSVISNFIQGQILTALIIGLIETIGLILLKVRYPVFLGLIGGAANIIPYFGPIVGAIPAVAIALLDSPTKALWVLLMFVIVQQIDNIFISPCIVESKLGLHPVTTVLVVLIGQEFFGIIGILVAVPLAAIIKVIFKRVIETVV